MEPFEPLEKFSPTFGSNGAGTDASIAYTLDPGMRDAVDRAAGGAKPAVDRIAGSAHQAVEMIAIAASDVVDALGMKADEVQDIQARLVDQCRGYVRENPLAAVGIALAAGLVLGKLLTPR